jgi:anti-anti-sigma factor
MYVPPELKVLQPTPSTVVIEILGEHDLSTRDETAELFARLVAENDLVVIDIGEAHFIDSSFLNNLVKAQRGAHEQEHTVLLQLGARPAVQRMLEIMQFLEHFDHVSSRDEALAWVP